MVRKILLLCFLLCLAISNVSFASLTASQENSFIACFKELNYHYGYTLGMAEGAKSRAKEQGNVFVQKAYDDTEIKTNINKVKATQQRINSLRGTIPNVLYTDFFNGAAIIIDNYEKLDKMAKEANVNKKFKNSDIFTAINIANSVADSKAQLLYDYMCVKFDRTEDEMFIDNAAYREFAIGMSYPDILEAMPVPGTPYESNVINGELVEIIRWPSDGKTYVYGKFVNNVLVSKYIK